VTYGDYIAMMTSSSGTPMEFMAEETTEGQHSLWTALNRDRCRIGTNFCRLFLLPHLVAKRHHAARVRFHFHEVQADIFIEPFEEWDPFTDQDGHDRIANFVD
jgi:hypothetical protein